MTTVSDPLVSVHRPAPGGTLRNAALAVWAGVTGVAPHVLHHVGPLAGAAILAGVAGRALFFAIGLVAAIPLLLRLYRRFRSWLAPAAAVAVFAAVFTFSTLAIAPLLTGSESTQQPQQPGIQLPSGHVAHHR